MIERISHELPRMREEYFSSHQALVNGLLKLMNEEGIDHTDVQVVNRAPGRQQYAVLAVFAVERSGTGNAPQVRPKLSDGRTTDPDAAHAGRLWPTEDFSAWWKRYYGERVSMPPAASASGDTTPVQYEYRVVSRTRQRARETPSATVTVPHDPNESLARLREVDPDTVAPVPVRFEPFDFDQEAGAATDVPEHAPPAVSDSESVQADMIPYDPRRAFMLADDIFRHFASVREGNAMIELFVAGHNEPVRIQVSRPANKNVKVLRAVQPDLVVTGRMAGENLAKFVASRGVGSDIIGYRITRSE